MQVLKVLTAKRKEVDITVPDAKPVSAAASEAKGAASTDIDTAHIKYGYCTEFIINLEKHYDENSEHEFKAYLESIGDSIVVVSDDDIVNTRSYQRSGSCHSEGH